MFAFNHGWYLDRPAGLLGTVAETVLGREAVEHLCMEAYLDRRDGTSEVVLETDVEIDVQGRVADPLKLRVAAPVEVDEDALAEGAVVSIEDALADAEGGAEVALREAVAAVEEQATQEVVDTLVRLARKLEAAGELELEYELDAELVFEDIAPHIRLALGDQHALGERW